MFLIIVLELIHLQLFGIFVPIPQTIHKSFSQIIYYLYILTYHKRNIKAIFFFIIHFKRIKI